MIYILFLAQLVILFFLSRQNIQELYVVVRKFFPEKFSHLLVAFIFLPGTIIHEFSHAFTAIILLLKVRQISVFPMIQQDRIKLGSVHYERKDPIRGLLVGITPIFGGLSLLFLMNFFKLIPNESIWLTILFGYLVFTISSTMFSSRQDLVDLLYILPIALLAIFIMYVFAISPEIIIEKLPDTQTFFKTLNMYLLFCEIIHIILLVILKSFNTLTKYAPAR